METLRSSSTSLLCFPERGPQQNITRCSTGKIRFWKEGGSTALPKICWRLSVTLGRLRQEDCKFEVRQTNKKIDAQTSLRRKRQSHGPFREGFWVV